MGNVCASTDDDDCDVGAMTQKETRAQQSPIGGGGGLVTAPDLPDVGTPAATLVDVAPSFIVNAIVFPLTSCGWGPYRSNPLRSPDFSPSPVSLSFPALLTSCQTGGITNMAVSFAKEKKYESISSKSIAARQVNEKLTARALRKVSTAVVAH